MTSRYRVEYALKTHRRDQFIEWVKGLLAVPFVLHSQPAGVFHHENDEVARMAAEAHRRYAEILRDVEEMINEHIDYSRENNPLPSKLRLLIPTAGPFFTRLPLEAAFKYQDSKRFISSRRFVAPSFNDVRLILNTAQIMAVTSSKLELATFDGDVTLYEDGQNLEPNNPIVPRLLELLRRNIKIGIVTAAGYNTANGYYTRLHGLLDAVATSLDLTPAQRRNLVIMGGEANYLFVLDPDAPYRLVPVSQKDWFTPEMATWSPLAIAALLDRAEAALRECIANLRLPAKLIRKDRAVGIVPATTDVRIPRESLEETVLVVQKVLEVEGAAVAPGVPFCAFNGGRDVFVDIGDKSWGVAVCQRWFSDAAGAEGSAAAGMEAAGLAVVAGPGVATATTGERRRVIEGKNTLHVGDQFLSAGSNDFKARSVGTTAWIANPPETVELLDELVMLLGKKE